MSGGVSPRSTVGQPGKTSASKATVAQRGPIPASNFTPGAASMSRRSRSDNLGAGVDTASSGLPPAHVDQYSIQGNRRGEGGTTAHSVASAQHGADRYRARTATRGAIEARGAG